VQTVTGAVHMLFLENVIGNAYQNLSNIVLTIRPNDLSTEKGVLVASHYDSLIGSPGAAASGRAAPDICVCKGAVYTVVGPFACCRRSAAHGESMWSCHDRRRLGLRITDCHHAGGGPCAGGRPQH
jgi:hypothetical protein